jgi:hypothetical protein
MLVCDCTIGLQIDSVCQISLGYCLIMYSLYPKFDGKGREVEIDEVHVYEKKRYGIVVLRKLI